MRDPHRCVVITRKELNALGVSLVVPITGGGAFARARGLTVPIQGRDTQGVAVCHQVRSLDLEARERTGTARYVETLDPSTLAEIVHRVLSVIDPAEG